MKPTEQNPLIADLLKLNKSEKMYSEETVINIIKQVLKMQSLKDGAGQKAECYPPEFVAFIAEDCVYEEGKWTYYSFGLNKDFNTLPGLFKFWQETINK